MAQVIRVSHVLFVDKKQRNLGIIAVMLYLLMKSQLKIAGKERFSDCMKFNIVKELRKAHLE